MSGTARSMTGVQARSLASVGGSEEETDIRGVVLESEDERQTKIFSFISATDDFFDKNAAQMRASKARRSGGRKGRRGLTAGGIKLHVIPNCIQEGPPRMVVMRGASDTKLRSMYEGNDSGHRSVVDIRHEHLATARFVAERMILKHLLRGVLCDRLTLGRSTDT